MRLQEPSAAQIALVAAALVDALRAFVPVVAMLWRRRRRLRRCVHLGAMHAQRCVQLECARTIVARVRLLHRDGGGIGGSVLQQMRLVPRSMCGLEAAIGAHVALLLLLYVSPRVASHLVRIVEHATALAARSRLGTGGWMLDQLMDAALVLRDEAIGAVGAAVFHVRRLLGMVVSHVVDHVVRMALLVAVFALVRSRCGRRASLNGHVGRFIRVDVAQVSLVIRMADQSFATVGARVAGEMLGHVVEQIGFVLERGVAEDAFDGCGGGGGGVGGGNSIC